MKNKMTRSRGQVPQRMLRRGTRYLDALLGREPAEYEVRRPSGAPLLSEATGAFGEPDSRGLRFPSRAAAERAAARVFNGGNYEVVKVKP